MSHLSLTTRRRDGHLRDPKALQRFLKKCRWPSAIATGEQVHRVKISVVPSLPRPQVYAGVDGLLTDVANQPLGMFTADCVPVFVSAKNGAVVGILHAGWRGVQGKILMRAVRLLKKRWGIAPADVRAWVGPSIGSCCFEVRWDVARYFPNARRRVKDRWTVDLGKALQCQAISLGIQWSRPATSKGCTMHDKRWFSYRRDQTADRQVSLILKTPSVVQ
jgi:YfiH family protein